MKYKYRLLYKPPLKDLDDNDISTWRKVFYFSIYDCPSELDLKVKIAEYKNLYHMNPRYIIVEDLEENRVIF